MWRSAVRNTPMVAGGVIVAVVVLVALLAPVLATHDPNAQQLGQRLMGPSTPGHLLGTDEYGRDVWSRLVYGARVSLQAGVVAVGVGALGGVLLGMLGGYFGGWVDMLAGRVFDILMSFPNILLALAIVAALGPSLTNTIVAIGIATIPRFGRVMRSAVISVRARDYVEAAEAVGSSSFAVMLRHIMPNVLSPLIVVSTLGIATAILLEATLSFLGLGVPPPTPTWGSMINGGKQYLQLAPWISTFSGLATMVAVLGFSLFGDGLRDVLDPRLKT